MGIMILGHYLIDNITQQQKICNMQHMAISCKWISSCWQRT